MKKPVKRIALIHDICSFGQAAMTNMLPVLWAKGFEPCPIPTMILSSHTGGYGMPAIYKLDGFIDNAQEHYVFNNIRFDSAIIGYIGTIENIESIEKFLDSNLVDGKVIFDPICGDNGKLYSNFDMEYVQALKKLLNRSDIITPNITEASFLTGITYKKGMNLEEFIKRLCIELSNLGPKNIVITSIDIGKEAIGTAIYNKCVDKLEIVQHPKEKENFHGTGDLFTALLMSHLEEAESLHSAVIKAGKLVAEAIRKSSEYDYDRREGLMINSIMQKLIY